MKTRKLKTRKLKTRKYASNKKGGNFSTMLKRMNPFHKSGNSIPNASKRSNVNQNSNDYKRKNISKKIYNAEQLRFRQQPP